MTSVQLYLTDFEKVTAAGTVTLTIQGPHLNRTFTGSLSIKGAPAGTAFDMTIGAKDYGNMFSPGPGGLFQLLTGEKLVATATGLTAGTLITGIFAGIDQPKDEATPWLGPTLVQSVALGGP